MTDAVAKLTDELTKLEVELSARDSAAFALERAKLAVMQRDLDDKAADIATYPERRRVQFHHDVLCLVLKASIERWVQLPEDLKTIVDPEALVSVAREFANHAYPPPKGEP